MKTHRFFLLFIPLTFLFVGSLTAQPGQPNQAAPRLTPEQRAQKIAQRQQEMLKLSDDQYRQVLEIHTNHAYKHEEQRKAMDQQRSQHRQMAQDIENSRQTELRKVLNDDQYRQWEQQREANRDRLREHRQSAPPRRGGGRF